ncbi:N-acetylmuramoyl-L-alanine amidase [Lutimaribacter sp. EGI FJ00015]|uniref:N-acetylmuramoyl-L-alanine amidase n=1 Tax=Lutimaribacter degradans TaxID=2945989 RepID=A0ACC5ZS69_9RHOB|nr:N-acetylmuramoyl-L-alanine amidase [Lutimaribacter sp. EGI FJ00013]MCM2561169.1 N-acetylmuramoyl-L-alanine amidase [Lutimaribacter sp. EGI FJ00013]MCO0611882.1 N-acetylmuramoyl-L-alanine amidase [Lutimaribacter sp. EGI FJ00015]MCO0634997.1 N-acetylmuramoyl-L-alanine amidase [Lutimaribacter sp. EGI FJ00014]
MSRLFAALILTIWGSAALAQDFSGLARVDATQSRIEDSRTGAVLSLSLSQGVPWRAYTLDAPARLVLDFREVQWDGLRADDFDRADAASQVRFGGFRPGWSRMVIDLSQPMTVAQAEMRILPDSGAAMLKLDMAQATPEEFAARSGAPRDPRWDLPAPSLSDAAPPRPMGEGPVIVVLDPGHGGIDPGAEHDGITEKDLMLTFARELRDVLRRAGGFDVVLTRDDDRFVSLERRVALAHEMRAHVFLSLHADALAQGQAHGATVHVLDDEASDAATRLLAERHDRDDLLSGVDLNGQDDVVAGILMDLARQETEPRTERLARSLVGGLQAAGGPVNRRPLRRGAFSVLKAADIPSVLIEVGFLSSPRDAENLKDPDWRLGIARGIRDGLVQWVADDLARAGLRRQ